MAMEPEYREMIGHALETAYSDVEEANVTGFLITCLYKGSDCKSEKYVRLPPIVLHGFCETSFAWLQASSLILFELSSI